MSESRLQEIVTKAVVGRAERRVAWGHTVPAEGVTGVLGVHVTNSIVAVKEEDGRPTVDLIVDCDLWCGGDKNTKVIRCSCRNTEVVEIRTHGKVLGDRDWKAVAGTARATGVKVEDGKVSLQLEADVAVEMSALTRLWVKSYELEHDVFQDLDGSGDDTSSSFSSTSSSGSESSRYTASAE